MTLDEFSNGIRKLRSIDSLDLEKAGFPRVKINAFLENPCDFFIRCDTESLNALWPLIVYANLNLPAPLKPSSVVPPDHRLRTSEIVITELAKAEVAFDEAPQSATRNDKAFVNSEDTLSILAGIRELREENIRLRAAIAQGPGACLYCSLPQDEWNKCKAGFPGCARADDAVNCPELGASLRLKEALLEIERLLGLLARERGY